MSHKNKVKGSDEKDSGSSESSNPDAQKVIGEIISEFDINVEILTDVMKIYSPAKLEDLTPEEAEVAYERLKQLRAPFDKSLKDLLLCQRNYKLEESLTMRVMELKDVYSAHSDTLSSTLAALKKIINEKKSNDLDRDNLQIIKNLLPGIEIQKFEGENLLDPMKFYTFRKTFFELVMARKGVSDAVKFMFLKNSLTGYALSIINSLTPDGTNLQKAIDMLDKEFLNKTAVCSKLFERLMSLTPLFDKHDKNFVETRKYIHCVRSLVNDLVLLGHNFDTGSTSNAMLSHLVFTRLPWLVQSAFTVRLKNNFPTFDDILEHYAEVIYQLNIKHASKDRVLSITKESASGKNNHVKALQTNNKSSKISKPLSEKGVCPKESKQKFTKTKNLSYANAVSSEVPKSSAKDRSLNTEDESQMKLCKFCKSKEHLTSFCNVYKTKIDRVNRLEAVGLCSICMSSTHKESVCKFKSAPFRFECFICKSNSHITPLCPSQSK